MPLVSFDQAKMNSALSVARLVVLVFAISSLISRSTQAAAPSKNASPLEFIDTSFENASPVWYEIDTNGTVQVHLLYDHERTSPNRAAGHFHFQLHAPTGAKLTLEFRNLDNVWNGRHASIAPELKA